jgi:flavin-dependent dehydrogenase
MNAVNTPNEHYDVVIIGAGWAGLTLARQLKLTNPELSVLQLEANTTFCAKVGEATVEMTGHYFVHRLGLVNYLYRNHLPKNGLRFFFDSKQHDLSLDQMSEHGTTSIPPHPAFQLDRARLEEDLVAMNREQGIDLLMGAKVTQFSIDSNDIHQVTYQYQGESHATSGRWLIDASGRASMIAKKHRLHHRRDVPKHASMWGRFSDIKDIDSLGDSEWRAKVNGRFLSTIHFTGKGYWIWVIPLSGGFTSIGIVCDKTVLEKPPMKQTEFLEFLAEHRGLGELMVDSQIEDFEAWGQLAYRADRYISEQRWATAGFAAMFLDPLFSGGGDFIAVINDSICNTIIADTACEDKAMADKQLMQTVPILNQQAHEFYQGFYAYISNVYPILDCGELCSPVLAYNTAVYFLEPSWDYMAGNMGDLQHWQKKDYIRRGYLALEKMLRQQVVSTANLMEKQDRYFDRNHEGFFESGADLYKYFVYQMGEKGRDGWRIELHTKLWVDIFLKVTGIKLNLPGFAKRKLVQECLNLPQILEMPQFNKADLPELLALLSQTLTEQLQQNTEHTVIAEITETSFATGDVNIQVVNDVEDEAEIKLLARQAKGIWATEQEYIAMPSMVPMFLRFCRQLDTSIMTQPVLVQETA